MDTSITVGMTIQAAPVERDVHALRAQGHDRDVQHLTASASAMIHRLASPERNGMEQVAHQTAQRLRRPKPHGPSGDRPRRPRGRAPSPPKGSQRKRGEVGPRSAALDGESGQEQRRRGDDEDKRHQADDSIAQ